ncbi:MAG TPA: HAMP domain-containing sensor histidine kinase [Clostridia bacterium]|nr:HAMP domain-containing sensor histidine kinase [Clostridia bacterium]
MAQPTSAKVNNPNATVPCSEGVQEVCHRSDTEQDMAGAARCQQCRSSMSIAAHELKTPLAVLGGYLEVLLSGKPGPLTSRQLEIIGELHRSRRQVLLLVNQFLNFNSLRFDQAELQFTVGDLHLCLNELVSFWAPKFRDKQIDFSFVMEDVRPFAFDYYKVQHIISNLLENAYKYSPEGSKMQLHAEPYFWDRRLDGQNFPMDRRRRSDQEPNSARITVSDTGSGIAPEFQQEIFQEFFRVPRQTKGIEGSGLGLAIARRLVYAHHGKIWVESSPGAGSKFAVLLPYTHDSTEVAEDQT